MRINSTTEGNKKNHKIKQKKYTKLFFLNGQARPGFYLTFWECQELQAKK